MKPKAVLVLEPTGGRSTSRFRAWLVVHDASGDRVTPFEGGRPSNVEEETVEVELCLDHFQKGNMRHCHCAGGRWLCV